jgi:hypothetical protein
MGIVDQHGNCVSGSFGNTGKCTAGVAVVAAIKRC